MDGEYSLPEIFDSLKLVSGFADIHMYRNFVLMRYENFYPPACYINYGIAGGYIREIPFFVDVVVDNGRWPAVQMIVMLLL